MFPSPRGDKENPYRSGSCNEPVDGFHPLAGIKKICMLRLGLAENEFPSPRGDKENQAGGQRGMNDDGFRPLAGIKKILRERMGVCAARFPSPRGDKENRQKHSNCISLTYAV